MDSNLGNDPFGSDNSVIADLNVDLGRSRGTESIGQNDSVREVARLGKELQTILEMNARFSESIFESHRKLPEIQKQVLDLQKQSLSVLRSTAKVEERITEAILKRGSAGDDSSPGGRHRAVVDAPDVPTHDPSGTTTRPAVGGSTPIPQSQVTPTRSPGPSSPSSSPKAPIPGKPLEGTNKVLEQLEAVTRVQSAGGGLNSAGGLAGALGNAIGGIGPEGNVASLIGDSLKTVAPWALGIGAAVGTVNKMAEQYADITKQGQGAHGGGFSEGLGYEMSVRSMALNPFISTEQARKIVMSGVNNGFTGKELDTVTDFMAQNLKTMNMDVDTSVKMLKLSVIQGGQSIQDLAKDLDTLKGAASLGPMTQQQISSNATDVMASLYGQGVDSDRVSGIMKNAALFGNIQGSPLYQSNLGVKLTQAFSNAGFAYNVARDQGIQVRDSKEIAANLANNGIDPHSAAWQYMVDWNKNQNPVKKGSAKDKQDPDARMREFLYFFGPQLPGIDDMTLRNIYSAIESNVDMIGQANSQVSQATGSNAVIDQSNSGYAQVQYAVQSKSWWGNVALGSASDIERETTDVHGVTGSRYRNKALESMVTSPQDVAVYNPKTGQTYKLNYDNKDMMDKIASGEFKLVKLAKGLSDYSMEGDLSKGTGGYIELTKDELAGTNASSSSYTLADSVAAGHLLDGVNSSGSYSGLGVKVSGEITMNADTARYFSYLSNPSYITYADTLGGKDPNTGVGGNSADPAGNGISGAVSGGSGTRKPG